LTELTLLAGLLICLGGVVLMVRQARRQRSWSREQPPGRTRLEGIHDLSGTAMIAGGISIMHLSSVAEHVNERTLPAHPWLSFFSGTIVLLAFGIQMGRLLMRWQLSRLQAVLDTESGEFTPRP
jgi:hypothetical protein